MSAAYLSISIFMTSCVGIFPLTRTKVYLPMVVSFVSAKMLKEKTKRMKMTRNANFWFFTGASFLDDYYPAIFPFQ
jgi:hypothetical protein